LRRRKRLQRRYDGNNGKINKGKGKKKQEKGKPEKACRIFL